MNAVNALDGILFEHGGGFRGVDLEGDRACGELLTGYQKYAWFRSTVLILSGLVPLLELIRRQPDSLLIYSVFVLVVLCRRRLATLVDRLPGSAALHLIVFFIAAGELAELFAWMGNYTKAAPEPGLLHPQLLANAILAVGLYIGWAVAWLIVLRWYRFSLTEAFLVTAFQGVFLESEAEGREPAARGRRRIEAGRSRRATEQNSRLADHRDKGGRALSSAG